MTGWWLALAVGAAGAVGGLLRFGLDTLFAAREGDENNRSHLPWATFSVNAIGCTLIGCAFGWYSQPDAWAYGFDVVAAGLAGALTTFSSWTVASVKLWEEGRRSAAAGNVFANIVVGWCCAYLGMWFGTSFI